MNANETILPAELLAAAQALADNLVASEPFVLYQKAEARLRADQMALDLLDSLWTSQGEIRARQQKGELRQSDIDSLRQLQRTVQANSTIMEYGQAQTNAVNLLREVNREISEQLGVDFAALARRSCC